MDAESAKKLAGNIAGFVMTLVIFLLLGVPILCTGRLAHIKPEKCMLPNFEYMRCANPLTFLTDSSCFDCLIVYRGFVALG